MLVKGPDAVPNYCYAPASHATISRVREMQRHSAEHGVPLAAAALQFSTRDERVASTIVGMSEPGRVEHTIRLNEWPIPDELWQKLLPLAAAGRDGVN
jgi:D-threo-aldose 1-dehydrogenase